MHKIEERILDLMEAISEEYGGSNGFEITLDDHAYRGLLNSLISDQYLRVGRYNYSDFTWQTPLGLVIARRKEAKGG